MKPGSVTHTLARMSLTLTLQVPAGKEGMEGFLAESQAGSITALWSPHDLTSRLGQSVLLMVRVPGGGNPAEGGGRLELWAGQGSVSEAHRASAPRPGSLSRSAAELRPEPGSREPSWAFPAQGAQLASWGG